MRRFRTFSMLSLLLTLLLWAPAAFAGDGANLLSYLPSSSKMVIGVNLEALRAAPVVQQATSMLTQSSSYRSAMGDVQAALPGFDAARDIRTIVIGSDSADGSPNEPVLVLVEANVDPEALSAALASEGSAVQPTASGWVTVVQGTTIAFLGNGQWAIGADAHVRAAAAGSASGLGRTLASNSRSALRGGSLWLAMDAPSSNRNQMRAIRGALQITNQVQATATVTATSAEMATELVGDFATTKARLSGSPEVAQFGLASVVESMQATADGEDLTIQVTIDEATWTMLSTTMLALIAAEL